MRKPMQLDPTTLEVATFLPIDGPRFQEEVPGGGDDDPPDWLTRVNCVSGFWVDCFSDV